MRKIYLFCNAGLSTSLLVTKMREAAKKIGYDAEIQAFPIADIGNHIEGVDIAILGPQIRFKLKEMQEEYPDKKIITLNMMMYGSMDGAGVINEVRKELNDL